MVTLTGQTQVGVGYWSSQALAEEGPGAEDVVVSAIQLGIWEAQSGELLPRDMRGASSMH